MVGLFCSSRKTFRNYNRKRLRKLQQFNNNIQMIYVNNLSEAAAKMTPQAGGMQLARPHQ